MCAVMNSPALGIVAYYHAAMGEAERCVRP
jgi:hypothetical protein